PFRIAAARVDDPAVLGQGPVSSQTAVTPSGGAAAQRRLNLWQPGGWSVLAMAREVLRAALAHDRTLERSRPPPRLDRTIAPPLCRGPAGRAGHRAGPRGHHLHHPHRLLPAQGDP